MLVFIPVLPDIKAAVTLSSKLTPCKSDLHQSILRHTGEGTKVICVFNVRVEAIGRFN